MAILFEAIFQFLQSLTFMHIVHAPERGVRIRMGKHIREVGPGVWFSWPAFDRFETVNPVTQTTASRKQMIRRPSDGVQIQIQFSVTYKVENVISYCMNVQDPDETLIDRGRGYIVHALCDGVEDPRQIGDRVQQELHALTRRPWGIAIEAVTVTTLCRPTPLYIGFDE